MTILIKKFKNFYIRIKSITFCKLWKSKKGSGIIDKIDAGVSTDTAFKWRAPGVGACKVTVEARSKRQEAREDDNQLSKWLVVQEKPEWLLPKPPSNLTATAGDRRVHLTI